MRQLLVIFGCGVLLVLVTICCIMGGGRWNAFAAPDQSGQIWALIVGINTYLYDDTQIPDLKYAVADAKLFYERLISPSGFGIPPGNIVLMTDDTDHPEWKPTRNNIIAMLETWITQAKENDMVIVYFSCHGMEFDGKTYLLAADTRYANPKETGIALREHVIDVLTTKCRARRKILILDSCHSGGGRGAAPMTKQMKEEMTPRGFKPQPKPTMPTEISFFATISSCNINEIALEDPKLGHGVFTYYLARYLSQEGDKNGNKVVELSELFDQVRDATTRHAARLGAKQNPILLMPRPPDPSEVPLLTVRPEPPKPTGTLAVDAEPWAWVYLSGKKLSETPLLLRNVPVGTYRLRLEHEKFGVKTVYITIEEGKTVSVKVNFLKNEVLINGQPVEATGIE